MTFSSNYVAVDTSKPKTTYRYDPLGREVQVDRPSGESLTTVRSGPYTTQVDANGHYKFLVRDAFGRLSRADETLVTFEDAFDALDGNDWDSQNCGQASGQVSCSASATLSRQGGYPLASDEGIKLEFKVGSSMTASFTLQAGGGYSWGVRTENGKLGVHRTPNDYQPEPILINALEPDTWYVLTLKAGGGGWFYTEAWKKNDPAVRGAYLGHEAGLAGLDWRFQHVVEQGTSYLDNYSELAYHTTTYTHNPLDLLSNVTDAGTNTTTVEYDPLGRKTRMVDPDMGEWLYRYDAAGNLTKQRDARNQAICFYYDELNRLEGKTYHPNTSDLDSLACSGPYKVGYDYDDALGDASSVNSWGRRRRAWVEASPSVSMTVWLTTTYEYDERGRVAEEKVRVMETGQPGETVLPTGFSYNSQDQPLTITHPDGEIVSTTYTAHGLPASLSSSLGTTFVSDATYTPEGRLDMLTLGSGLQVDRSYFPWATPNGQGRLQRIQAGTVASPTLLLDLAYTYDAVGNVASITDTGVSTAFSYDALDRLIGAEGAYASTYTYTAIGNLTSLVGGGITTTLAYTDPAHVHAASAVDGVSYTYDPNGNLTQRTVNGVTYSLDYDAENRLASVTNEDTGQITTFTYDADGRLMRRDSGAGTWLYPNADYEVRVARSDVDDDGETTVVDLIDIAAHLGSSGTAWDMDRSGTVTTVDVTSAATEWREVVDETLKYYRLGDRRVALRRVPSGDTGELYYLFSDHLGSTSTTYRASDGATETLRYYPYGGIRTGHVPTDRRFTGQRWDATIGLYDYQARYYNAQIGRFVQPDTIVPEPGNPQDLNRFAYVRNNPLTYTDPTGHSAPYERPEVPLPSWAQSGVMRKALSVGCFFLSCHVDDERGVVQGPTPDEIELSIQPVPMSLVSGPAASFGDDAARAGVSLFRNFKGHPATKGKLFVDWFKINMLENPATGGRRIPSRSGTTKFRVPDIVEGEALFELKNLARETRNLGSRFWSQAEDYIAWAERKNLEAYYVFGDVPDQDVAQRLKELEIIVTYIDDVGRWVEYHSGRILKEP